MCNSLFHCITFVWNVCGIHLLCVGFDPLNSVRLGLQRDVCSESLKSWVLLMLPDKVIELRDMRRISSYVTNWKTTFPETGGCLHLRTTEFWKTKWKAMTFLKTGMRGFEYQKKNWSRAAIMFSSSYGQILCISKRMSVLQSFSTKSNYFLLHYVERYRTWQKHHIEWLVLIGVMLYYYMSAYHIDNIIMRSFNVL